MKALPPDWDILEGKSAAFVSASLATDLALLFSEPVEEWKNEVSTPNESKMVWYCRDIKEVQPVPWLRGIHTVAGDTWAGYLTQGRTRFSITRGASSVCMTVGAPRRSKLTWVGMAMCFLPSGKEKLELGLRYHQRVSLEEHSGLFWDNMSQAWRQKMTWPVWGQLRRPGDLEKQRAWSQFPSPCQPLPAGPTPAPFCKGTIALPALLSAQSLPMGSFYKNVYIIFGEGDGNPLHHITAELPVP